MQKSPPHLQRALMNWQISVTGIQPLRLLLIMETRI